ncbi:MAG TPA: hypothetical protein PKC43_06590 [Phycisphaerales bacterium]|nr:hypothetical protein [Phycisphaerales bacterium]HMP37099.1 hypothetical protein [Phycisphaerales bacterium]
MARPNKTKTRAVMPRRTTRPRGVVETTGRLLLSELARREGVSPATVWRWCRRGSLSAGGLRLVLPSIRIGGRWAVEHDAYIDWTRRLAEPAPTADEHPTLAKVRRMTPDELRRESARAVGIAEAGRA